MPILGDGYATSLTVDAMVKSRDGTSDPSDSKINVLDHPVANEGATTSDPKRWADWVRQAIGLNELVGSLQFHRDGDQLTVYHCEIERKKPDAAAKAAAAPAPAPAIKATLDIATLERPDKSCFQKQIPLVLAWADLREERMTEILAQIDNQYAFWGAVVPLHTPRMKAVMEVVDLAVQMVVAVEMRFKHEFGVWRPAELSAQVQPMISTPEHGAFPAGHAAQAYAVAIVLEKMLQLQPTDPRAVQLQRIAARISINRVIAGVHYPVDLMAGRVLGQALGEYFVARCEAGSGNYHSFPYGSALDSQDFPATSSSNDWAPYTGSQRAPHNAKVAPSPFLSAMWTEAQTGCARNGYLISTAATNPALPPQPPFSAVPFVKP